MGIFTTVKERRAAAKKLTDFHVSRFILAVHHWKAFTSAGPFNWQGPVLADRANSNLVPKDQKGVYCFVAEPRIAAHPACAYLMYVGSTTRNFRARFEEYFDEMDDLKGRPLVQEMLINWSGASGALYFYYSALTKDILETEQALRVALLPPMNDTIAAELDKVRKAVLK